MRKLLLAACTAPFLFLSACTPDVAEIQRITQQVCGFVPTAVTISSMFPNPYTVPAAAIAQAICSAVTAQVPMSTRSRMVKRGSIAQTAVTVTVQGQQFNVVGFFTR